MDDSRFRPLHDLRLALTIGAALSIVACDRTPSPDSTGSVRQTLTVAGSGSAHYDLLADLPLEHGYPTREGMELLSEELTFQRGVQTWLWALPALDAFAMKEASEAKFGKGYHVLPVWKRRLDAKTQLATASFDVIPAIGYLDLAADGPLVLEVPPGLQGTLVDFFQRPICSAAAIERQQWCGAVGAAGPDRGKGGKYLLLPPDHAGRLPAGYLAFRSRTYNVLVSLQGFFEDPNALEEPVQLIERTRIYPLGKRESAPPMQFPDASAAPVNMLHPRNGSAFDLLSRFVDREYADPQDAPMYDMLAKLGIVKGQPFQPDAQRRDLLDKAARAASRMSLTAVLTGRDFANAGAAAGAADTGAKYPPMFIDSRGEFLLGEHSYRLHLPPNVPAAQLWSVTAYDAATTSGLDNGQPFPSINALDRPTQNADGSVDIHFGPKAPGEGANWIATPADKGYFVILRVYAPTQAFFDRTWKPGNLERTG